ncbi:hypothetical protein N2152v2_008654, partial [Parachlorella kessleri]
LLYGQVQVLVMNNKPGQHPEFEALRQRVAAGDAGDTFAAKAALYISFLDNPGTVTDPAPDLPEPDDLNNPGDRPGSQVRKQTCDVISLLRHAAPLSSYYLFMEDDFQVCPYALRALQYALTKASSAPHLAHWIALRASYGMNGIVMRNEDLPALDDFLWQHITVKPPDLLWVEFLIRQPLPGSDHDTGRPLSMADKPVPVGSRRPFVVYKYNLMAHLGTISSFAVRPDRPAWPGCYASMNKVWSLQTVERFALRCRLLDDLSPCPARSMPQGAKPAEPWLKMPLDWPLAAGLLPGQPARSPRLSVAPRTPRLPRREEASEGQQQQQQALEQHGEQQQQKQEMRPGGWGVP